MTVMIMKNQELLLSEMSNDEITVGNSKEYWKLCEAEDRYKLTAETAVAAKLWCKRT